MIEIKLEKCRMYDDDYGFDEDKEEMRFYTDG